MEQRQRLAVFVHLHRVIDDQIHRHERIDALGIAAGALHRRTHRRQVYDRGDASKILKDDTGWLEGQFRLRRHASRSRPASPCTSFSVTWKLSRFRRQLSSSTLIEKWEAMQIAQALSASWLRSKNANVAGLGGKCGGRAKWVLCAHDGCDGDPMMVYATIARGGADSRSSFYRGQCSLPSQRSRILCAAKVAHKQPDAVCRRSANKNAGTLDVSRGVGCWHFRPKSRLPVD